MNKKCYLVMHDTDSTEGRGPIEPVKVFVSHEDAVNFVKGKPGIWGQAQPNKPYVFHIDNRNFEDWNMYRIVELDLE